MTGTKAGQILFFQRLRAAGRRPAMAFRACADFPLRRLAAACILASTWAYGGEHRMSFLLALALHGVLGREVPETVSPAAFRGRYVLAISACTRPDAPQVIIGERVVEWHGRRDRILFSERISPRETHIFLERPASPPGVRELHFELQGADAGFLLVLDHLSDAEDILKNGAPIPDKSVVGFYQRCG